MFMKKSTIALCSCSGLPALIPSRASITSSYASSPRCPPARSSTSGKQHRKYATIRDSAKQSPASRDDLPPSLQQWPSHPNPTPYDIFSCARHTTYSKARFFELVKIYHPDRHRQVPNDTLTPTSRLERYRLVIAANEILSDPAKRRAYDLYGAGWGAHLPGGLENFHRTVDRSWRQEPGNPSMNATWEDWERWYGEQAARNGEPKPKQRPVYMSNELFVAVLCAFIIMGSMGQARRANNHTMNLVEMREAEHGAISGGMVRRRTEQAGLTRHERVETFLRSRDGWNIAQEQSGTRVLDEDDK